MLSLAAAVGVAILAAWMLAPWLNMGDETTSPADLTRLALTIAAGVGGVVALVVAYRRQRDLEQSRFIEGFGAAAKQLGDADVAVRMAGVYAMAGVADQTSRLKRQQCIDVLCGYLRLPYSPERGNNHQSGLTIKRPLRREGGLEEELRFQYRQNDMEVRQAIVSVITDHLRNWSWSANDFEFSGCHLENADFRNAVFNGHSVRFAGVTFSGRYTLFGEASFFGKYTSFEEATFISANTSFEEATFIGANISFEKATFSSEDTSFEKAIFRGKNTSFRLADFGKNRVSFEYPKEWRPDPAFDWSAEGNEGKPKPPNVLPQDWPPGPNRSRSSARVS
ncbi:pentapeptide repeat-containing protein [Pseudarthrobacter oxydans]|uniref:pentapeptide repeat-containing protein n=1 Tax=Pseudarthrobacter oxydans TaxID=1671 RepID=UPI003417BA4E